MKNMEAKLELKFKDLTEVKMLRPVFQIEDSLHYRNSKKKNVKLKEPKAGSSPFQSTFIRVDGLMFIRTQNPYIKSFNIT